MAEPLLFELLPRLRAEAGLSQHDLSFAAARRGHEISVNTIQSYEKPTYAGRVPEVEILEAIAAGLGIKPDVFYEWPIAVARRAARPDVTGRAKKAAQRLADTPSTSRRKRRAVGGGDAGTS